ncbi:MAG: methyltransferase domain-containing protein [Trueperaceae bacterium]
MSQSSRSISRPNWLFDEFQDFGWSEAGELEEYDKKANVDPQVERERLLALGVSNRHVVVDFGCGTGALALEAANLCRRVIAVDVSEAMLAQTRRKAEKLGLTNIEYVQQGFLSYRHAGELADFVFTQRTLHHLPDLWKVRALQRMHDVIKPGGVLFVRDILFSFEPGEADDAIEAWIDSRPAGSFPREFFEHDVREEYITYTWLFEAMLDRVGFDIEDASYGDWQAYAKYFCVKRR